MTVSMTVGLTHPWDFSTCQLRDDAVAIQASLSDLDTVPGLFSSPEVLGHQQTYKYQIPPSG